MILFQNGCIAFWNETLHVDSFTLELYSFQCKVKDLSHV